jgi:hypothetical protein
MLNIRPFCHSLASRAGNGSPHRSRIHHVLGAVLIASGVFSPAALAADVSDGALAIAWKCEQQYDAYYHVRCIAQPSQSAAVPTALPVSIAAPAALSVQGVDMRAVALRDVQEIFAHGWSVPLYAQPSDAQSVTQLLAAVLCDTAPRCTVTYGTGATRSSQY